MTVTLVGFGTELITLDPTRVRHFDDIEALLETMDAETRKRRGALAMAGHDSVLTGRTGSAQHTQWTPHLVLLAAQPTEDQAAKIAELVADSGRLGISYVAATEVNGLPGATWKIEITPDGRLLAPFLGLELQAQLLPQARHDAVVQLFADATPDDDRDPDPSTPQFMVDITPSGRPAVYARLVGTYEITGLDAPDAEHSPLLHEALVMLLLHREGVHPRVLASGLWPRGVTEDVRDALIERLRTWLGNDPDGSPRLGTDATGRLSLAPSVVSDLDVLRTLADVALALSAHHLEAGNPTPALNALNTALTITPTDERLWNELLRAAHATGDTAKLESTAASLIARNHEHSGGARSLPPRTEALLDELLPSWRDA